MQNNKVYTVKESTERIQSYCAIQDRCQWEVERKMKEWKSKGYDTTILKHKLGIKYKVIRISKSKKKLSKKRIPKCKTYYQRKFFTYR